MKSIVVFIAILLLQEVAFAQWQQTNGPVFSWSTHDTIRQTAINPYSIIASNGRLFIGGQNGLLESTDSGRTWYDIRSRLDSNGTQLWSTALTKLDSDLFASNGIHVFRSTNSGQSWFHADTGLSGSKVYRMASNAGILYAVTDEQQTSSLYRSTNKGSSWSRFGQTWKWVKKISASNTKLFAFGDQWACDSCGPFVSGDTGKTWTKFTKGRSIAANANYIITEDSLAFSTDNGASWSTPTGFKKMLVGHLFVNGNLLIVSGSVYDGGVDGFCRSTDAGISWDTSQLPRTGGELTMIGSRVYASSSNGIFQSVDSGLHWSEVGIKDTEIHFYDTLPVQSLISLGSRVVAGTNRGTYGTTDDGDSWDSTASLVHGIRTFLSSSSNLFAGTNDGSGDTSGGIFHSTDTGISWTRISVGFHNVNALASSGNSLFAGTDSGIYVSPNNGTNWSPGFRQVHVNAIAAHGSKVIAGTTANGLIISTNNGSSWSASGGSLPITDVQSLAVKGGILFAGTSGNGLFLSKDTGATWTDISVGLPASSVYALEVSSNQFFAGTDGGGIYRTNDSGKTWKEVDSGLSNLKVTSLAIRNGDLFAGTIGGGVWKRPLSQMLIIANQNGVIANSPVANISAFPNPLTTSTTIRFNVSESGHADIRVVNALGVDVARVFSGDLLPGEHTFNWSPQNLTSGMYECIIRLANGTVRRLPLIAE